MDSALALLAGSIVYAAQEARREVGAIKAGAMEVAGVWNLAMPCWSGSQRLIVFWVRPEWARLLVEARDFLVRAVDGEDSPVGMSYRWGGTMPRRGPRSCADAMHVATLEVTMRSALAGTHVSSFWFDVRHFQLVLTGLLSAKQLLICSSRPQNRSIEGLARTPGLLCSVEPGQDVRPLRALLESYKQWTYSRDTR